MSNIRVFNIDIEPQSVVGILSKTGMSPSAWNVYFAGDNDEITWLKTADSEDPNSATFPFQGIWITDGSEIYVLNSHKKLSITLQILFTPVISEQSAPTQETESA